MKVEPLEITIRDLVKGYVDNEEEGVFGYSGRLNIRPPYQREFVYKDHQRDAVVNTVCKGFPLNVMYWCVRDDGDFEIIDGQQRTVSICQYISGDFSFEKRYFANLTEDLQNQILDYKLMIYQCSGTESERLDWFRTINIASEKLTNQELRNAVYTGTWVTDAKRHFSKTRCPADGLGGKYMTGSAIRQEYLETAIKWISNNNIEDYMGTHQHNPDANELWSYFQKVIDWVKATFPKYRKEMKGLDWGEYYNTHKADDLAPTVLEAKIKILMMDDDVTNKKGIYPYLLSGKERHLNVRPFSDAQKREAFEKQDGICVLCRNTLSEDQMEADHITPWHEGGKTISENCQMLCRECNRRKSGK